MTVRPKKTWQERKEGCKPNVLRAIENNDIEALKDALPPLQKAFAEEYIKDFNGSHAVQRTDSTTKYPEKVAYLWLNNIGVKAYIKHLTQERTERLKIDQGYVVQKLIRTLELAELEKNHQAVLRAAELLAKHLGMFTEKQEITGKDGGAIQFERLTQDADAFDSAIVRLVERNREDDGTSEAG